MPSVVTEDINSRLASMKEQILSRSSIQPIIEKFNLYADQHLSMDDRITLARKNIDIQPITSEIARSNGLPGFKIFFTASDAHTAQEVCAEITTLFTGANLRSRSEAAEGTTDFLRSSSTTPSAPSTTRTQSWPPSSASTSECCPRMRPATSTSSAP